MSSRNFTLATAGHVDHGKSSVVKALTGIDPDRLPEEKARGITIDLGFAFLEQEGPVPDSPLFIGIVDVPGHEDFVKNMVAGVGSIDAALLVVAADDGWMPQTEEHLQILSYLGVTAAVVALTKVDLVSTTTRTERAHQLRDSLQDSVFASAPVIPVSTATGEGVAELKAALAQMFSALPAPADLGKPRLPIDRVFSLHGIGTVVTGTLTGGHLRRGEPVVIQPQGLPTRIRSLQSHNRDMPAVVPGSRVALNLSDVEVAARAAANQTAVSRGQVITSPGLGSASETIDVILTMSARSGREFSRSAGAPARVTPSPVRTGARVRLHYGSANCAARILLPGPDALGPGTPSIAQLRCEAPVFMFAGDRFILRDWPERRTLAGGVVLDPVARQRDFRTPRQQSFLRARASAPADAAVCVFSLLQRDGVVRREGLLDQARFSRPAVAQAVAELQAGGRLHSVGPWVFDRHWWDTVLNRAVAAIDAKHREAPQALGLAVREVRTVIASDPAAAPLADEFLAELSRIGFKQEAGVIRRANHQPSLPEPLRAAGARVRAALAAKPLEPPPRKELAADTAAQQALRFLVETGEAVELSADTVIGRAGYERGRELVVAHLRAKGHATASELRQALSTNRRVIIPLLERLDREGVTVRQDEMRVLRAS